MTTEPKDVWESWKNRVDLLKSVGIITLLVEIAFIPNLIPTWMTYARVDELDFGGMKWARSVKAANAAEHQMDNLLYDVRQDLVPRLKDSQAELCGLLPWNSAARSQGTPPAHNPIPVDVQNACSEVGADKPATDTLSRVQTVIVQNQAAIKQAKGTLVTTRQVIVDNTKLLPSQPESPWIILLSSFPLQEEAKVKQYKEGVLAKGFPNVLSYKNRNRFRTALRYNSREDAAAALQAVINQIPRARRLHGQPQNLVRQWCYRQT